MKWKVVIIDDSEKDIRLLESILSDFRFIEVEKRFTDPLKFKAEQNSLKFDAIFLDVNMPSLSGIELLRDVKKPIVFVTGEGKQYAEELSDVKLFHKNVVGVIVKPVNQKRVEAALEFIKDKLKSKTHIQVNTSLGKELVEINSIELISSQDIDLKNSLSEMSSAQGEHKLIYRKGMEPLLIHSRNLPSLLVDLPANQFIQINRFDIVNKDNISLVVKSDEIDITYTSRKKLEVKAVTRPLNKEGKLRFKELFNL